MPLEDEHFNKEGSPLNILEFFHSLFLNGEEEVGRSAFILDSTFFIAFNLLEKNGYNRKRDRETLVVAIKFF